MHDATVVSRKQAMNLSNSHASRAKQILALAGFLVGYTGLTREAYALDLRQYASWCQEYHIGLFQARRADIECFARDLEVRSRARATITCRLCTTAGFYRGLHPIGAEPSG
jgi:site-specific recombinase XerD